MASPVIASESRTGSTTETGGASATQRSLTWTATLRLWLAAAGATLAVLLLIGAISHRFVEGALREVHEARLANLLDAEESVLELMQPGGGSKALLSPRSGVAYVFARDGRIVWTSAGQGAASLPPELLAAIDTPGRDAMQLDVYAGPAGAPVIGAARWLARQERGVAIELYADRAYAPLAALERSLAAVAILAALAGIAWLALLVRRRGAPRQFGAYMLDRPLGEGGMAAVYLAHHALLKRPTALKILKLHRLGEGFVARFEREVRLASQLVHPNIVEIYDYGHTRQGRVYYAMEYLDGFDLQQLVAAGGPAPAARAIHLLRQLCAGLAEAHANGLVHRDIKPQNLMVCVRGTEHDVLKILDFGLVKNLTAPDTRDLTRDARILGTPLYMAPERFRSPGDVDARADIYSVGALAFFLLTGRDLFQAADDAGLLQRILNEDAARPSTCAPQPLPVELDLLVTACLEKHREDRPQRIADLIEALDALAATYRWTQREAADWWVQHRADKAHRGADMS
ncbi:MAG: serine/threonine-protein kinase [Burkholderiales bacterium]